MHAVYVGVTGTIFANLVISKRISEHENYGKVRYTSEPLVFLVQFLARVNCPEEKLN